jgi:Mg/Co/Ni transporter MgtE (contains CBS domain)
LEHSL